MKKLSGNKIGLKANQIRRLENFYRRSIPTEYLISPEFSRDFCRISREIRRQLGLLVDRQGKIFRIIIGDHHKIVIPAFTGYRTGPGRLNGLRCIHTHLNNEKLTEDDLTDLALLKLDMMAAITVSEKGLPLKLHFAHLRPESTKYDTPYHIFQPIDPAHADIGCLELILALEEEISRNGALISTDYNKERAILVSVTTSSKKKAEDSLDELRELSISSGIQVLGTVLQQRKKVDPRFLIGRGKLSEISITALMKGTGLIVFDSELNPSQIRSITDKTDLKVIDRTQLILDIFAQRAISMEGKLQVELAQLKYLLPRLITKNRAMSRLTGGIGGRGPGETKLEINRRRVHDRIRRIEKDLSMVRKRRGQQKAKRNKRGLPVVSIVGYTNAGKSTLLNTLTNSEVLAESRMFATLDPSSRRLRFPRDAEVIITDTVGFIRNLPKELMIAFRATLEELEQADLILHVVDISNPRYEEHIESVEKTLDQLSLGRIPSLYVFNKKDLAGESFGDNAAKRLGGVAVSATIKSTLKPLINKMEDHFIGLNTKGHLTQVEQNRH